MRVFQTAALATACLGLLAACSSTPPAPVVPAASPASTASVPVAAPKAAPPATVASSAPERKVASVVLPPHLDPASALTTKRSVFFAFDMFSVQPEYQGVVELHGKYLAMNPRLAIRVEGNADERGSKEYNLALGQKRAEAVTRALRLLGVKDSQMEAISWGEEKPRATGQTEAAFSQNRRADIVYAKP